MLGIVRRGGESWWDSRWGAIRRSGLWPRRPAAVQPRLGDEGQGPCWRRGPRYQRLVELSRTGSSILWLALAWSDRGVCRLVVLKALDGKRSKDAEAIARRVSEARLSARMNHPNVVQVLDLLQEGGAPVVVMEYLPGPSLATLIASDSPAFTLELRLAIVVRLLRGLEHVHRLRDFDGRPLRVIHGAVSPDNIVVSDEGHVKLIDFGRCSFRNDAPVLPQRRALPYVAPEQLGGALDHRVDLFSVGVVLWELVARRPLWGQLPVPALVRRLVAGEIPALLEAAPAVDPDLERICRRALSPRPDSRYRSAAEMRDELEAYLARRGGGSPDSAIAALVRSACREERQQRQRLLETRLSELGLSAMRAPPSSRLRWANARELLAGVTRGARRRALGTGAVALLLVAWLLARAGADPSPEGDAPARARRSSGADAAGPTTPHPSWEPELLAQPARMVRLEVVVQPPSAVVYLDGQRMSTNPLDAHLVLDSRPHTLRASAPGHAELVSTFQVGSDLRLAAELTRYPSE